MSEAVNHPKHYGGEDNLYEAIKVIEAWDLGFNLGNSVKYISRFGKKQNKSNKLVEDLEKAVWYLQREIEKLERIPDSDLQIKVECKFYKKKIQIGSLAYVCPKETDLKSEQFINVIINKFIVENPQFAQDIDSIRIGVGIADN